MLSFATITFIAANLASTGTDDQLLSQILDGLQDNRVSRNLLFGAADCDACKAAFSDDKYVALRTLIEGT